MAFNKFKTVWIKQKNIWLNRKIQIYEALVVSVMMYGSQSWAAPRHIIEKLDASHRRHLRQILNYKYPHIISNKSLYKRCKTVPLSKRVELYRWRMFGHILRSPENSPAQTALSYALESVNIFKSRIGRHQTNLLDILKTDLIKRGYNLNNINDLHILRDVASDRVHWQSIFDDTA